MNQINWYYNEEQKLKISLASAMHKNAPNAVDRKAHLNRFAFSLRKLEPVLNVSNLNFKYCVKTSPNGRSTDQLGGQ